MDNKFDLIVVGTGFSSTFFLHRYLQKTKSSSRILVLDRGKHDSHSWQIKNNRNSSKDNDNFVKNNNPDKQWVFTIGFGGGSNCWWAGTPRMMSSDFELQTRYGKGKDWPLKYDELEPYYFEAETVMQVSGPDYGDFLNRSAPYPQPPHLFNRPDYLMKQAYKDLYFQQPTARAKVSTSNRPQCCASGTCHLCPTDAKFSIQNEMKSIYKDSRVKLLLDSPVQTLITNNDLATGVVYGKQGETHKAYGDLIILGANAFFNAHIMLRSGMKHRLLGKLLNEQVSYNATIDLDGIEGFQGSTSVTGHAFHLYDGPHRKERAACLLESHNTPNILRMERGKWSHRMLLRCIIEDLPDERNYINVDPSAPSKVEIHYKGHSNYTQKTIDRLPEDLSIILSPLPVERIYPLKHNRTDSHILGTTVMGDNQNNSIVDRHLIHHKYRNLAVLGSGAFPTCPPVNPTLTLSALSLWSADYLLG
jgi:choline dehydrogenase-like flavoprotein